MYHFNCMYQFYLIKMILQYLENFVNAIEVLIYKRKNVKLLGNKSGK